MASLDTIFKAYDIRGTVPGQLDARLAEAIGAAFARFARAPRIVLARDMRQSGIELSRAFTTGATAQGAPVRSFVDVGALRPLRVVADTANGMGGLVVPRIFGPLPFELEVLFPDLDGTFPNHPADPIQVENLKDLRARVVEAEADIGLA